jgi:hypothetical protein
MTKLNKIKVADILMTLGKGVKQWILTISLS